MSRQVSIFATERAQMTDSIRRTVDLLNEYGPRYRRWRVAWSGGKDSTAVVTLLVYLIQSGQVQAPADGLEVLYADTRMELPPLWLADRGIFATVAGSGAVVMGCEVTLPVLAAVLRALGWEVDDGAQNIYAHDA